MNHGVVTKVKVLLVGESCGDSNTDKALRDIADVHSIPRLSHADLTRAVQIAVKTNGPFEVFAVCTNPYSVFSESFLLRRWRAS